MNDQTRTVTELAKPTDFLSREQITEFRTVVPWRATWLLAHCWLVILGTWIVCAIWPNPVTITIGVLVIGARQLGLGVLNHDAAHHTLYKNRRLNDWVAEWITNRPLFGATVVPYRVYHLDHHKYTQQPNDPDLGLSAPFPISKKSLARKMFRDLTGQTGWKQHTATIKGAFGKDPDPKARWARFMRRLGPNLLINLVFLAGFTAAGVWYLYFLLWVLPVFTWQLAISRIRNIGEHAAVPDDNDRLRNTRTTTAGLLTRAFIAPYYVNYHLEHHLLVSCPCYKLPAMHRTLIDKGLRDRMELKPSYWKMLDHATTAPA